MHRRITQATLGTLIVAGSCFGLAAASSAATPAIQGCVGTTFAQAAQGPGPLGPIIADFAHAPDTAHPGLGDGIQQLQAGDLPDEVALNTCNG
jgi:hypothetical protein